MEKIVFFLQDFNFVCNFLQPVSEARAS
ncbi:hypothetical protein AT5G25756 [Arabidopsis thaliana]|uniref:Uncharacterized protein n=1 Tax=Arabidopsis thaliana TaxID=3702 RepID=A0A1P8BFI2_ARATH|nr:uncharacterized protein AT5G25756 [Arabidopsis thaliana]ANM70372.1 hypothetical protein AT5G25756 [Arabidopsis thaliana]|eukprot:NP_001331988.1 hypothetical protein AT5G25756 [Arabidopsis thaliana]